MAEIKITVDINSAIRNIGRLDDAFDDMNAGAVDADSNIGRVDDAIDKAGREVDDFGRESVQAFGKVDGSLDQIGIGGIAMGNILADAFSRVIESAGRAIRVLIETGAEFEQQMAKVRAISGATESEFSMLEQTARELGSTTQFSAGQAAAGLQFLAQAGFRTEESIAALPGILSVAAAAGSDLGETADIVSNALSGFNLEADETNRLGDIITSTFTSSNTTLQSLGESFRVIAPIASSFGISVEETAAAIGRLGDAGIQGSIAGTQLRGALSRLAKPSSEAADVLEQLNIQTSDAEGNFLSLPEIVGQFERGLEGLTQAERQNALATVVGQEALSSFSVLLQAGQSDLEGYTAQLRDSEGAANSVAKTQNDTLQGSFNRLQSAVDELSIALFDRFGGAIRSVTDGFTNFVNVVSDFLALPASEKIEEERIGLNSLALQLARTNEGEERRGQLIAELNDKYPSFLKGLSDETLSNEKLKERLDDVNAAYLRKIAIKTQEERIEEATRQALQAGREEQEARTNALNRLREVNERYGLGLDLVNDSIEDNIQKARERLSVSAVEQTDQRGRIIAQNEEAKALDSLSFANTQVASTTRTAGDRQAELNKIISDANTQIEKLLGNQRELNQEQAGTVDPEGGEVSVPVKPTFDIETFDDTIIKEELSQLDIQTNIEPIMPEGSIARVLQQNRFLQSQLTQVTTQGERDRLNALIQANDRKLASMRKVAKTEEELQKERIKQSLELAATQADNAKDAAAAFANSIRAKLKAYIAEAVAAAALSALRSIPFPFNIAAAAAAATAATTLFNSVIPAFATGVTNFQGGTALVGEEGPELVTLPGGSNVITNENTERLIDAGVVDTGRLNVNSISEAQSADEDVSDSTINQFRNLRNVSSVTDAGQVSASVTNISEAKNSDSFNTGQMSAPVYSITEAQTTGARPINVQGGNSVSGSSRINTNTELRQLQESFQSSQNRDSERLNTVTREVGSNLNSMASRGSNTNVNVDVKDIVIEGEQLRIVLQNNENIRKVAGIA